MESPTSSVSDTGSPDSHKRRRTEEPESPSSVKLQPLADPANYPRKRVSVACEICRLRKTRCDAKRPSCSFCISLGVECSYRKPSGVLANMMTRAKQGDSVRALQARVEIIERTLSGARFLPSPPIDATTYSVAASTPHSTQGCSPVTLSAETPQRTSSISDPIIETKATLPTVGLSLSVSNLGKLANHPRPQALLSLDYDDSENYIESEMHANELIYKCGKELNAEHPLNLDPEACWAHQRSFVRNILPWFPLFSEQACVQHLEFATEARFDAACSSSALAYYVLALGAFSRADHLRSDNPAEFPGLQYFAAARDLPELPGISHSIELVQTQILRTLYFLLCMRPLAAIDSILPACRTIVSLIHLKRHLRQDTYFRNSCHRAYWVCYIIEKELLPYSCSHTTGLLDLGEIVPLPGSKHDEPGMLWLLSEIALRRIFTNVSGNEIEQNFQPLVFYELNKQLARWYEGLPPAIKFPMGMTPIVDPQKAFLRAQYYAVLIIQHWPFLVRLLTAPSESEDQYKQLMDGSTKALEYCVLYIGAMESSIRDRHVMLFANNVGTYCICMLMLCVYGHPEIAPTGVELEDSIRKAYKMVSMWAANQNVQAKVHRIDLLLRERNFPLVPLQGT